LIIRLVEKCDDSYFHGTDGMTYRVTAPVSTTDLCVDCLPSRLLAPRYVTVAQLLLARLSFASQGLWSVLCMPRNQFVVFDACKVMIADWKRLQMIENRHRLINT